MNYEVLSIALFDKQVKRLAKKYPSLRQDLRTLIDSLLQRPLQGDALGDNFYKIRMAIISKGKGKSGGARVITYVKVIAETVYLTSIYDKSERSTITESDLEQIFKLIP